MQARLQNILEGAAPLVCTFNPRAAGIEIPSIKVPSAQKQHHVLPSLGDDQCQ